MKCPKCGKKLKWQFYDNRYECIKGPRDRTEGCNYIYYPEGEPDENIITYEGNKEDEKKSNKTNKGKKG